MSRTESLKEETKKAFCDSASAFIGKLLNNILSVVDNVWRSFYLKSHRRFGRPAFALMICIIMKSLNCNFVFIYPSTTENLAVFIWIELQKQLPTNYLYEVRIHETDKNVIFYRGE